jgi:hypothetical protein
MAISFQSDEEVLRKLRDKLRKMTDEELIRFGKEVRRLAENPFQRQLEEARAEWKRRNHQLRRTPGLQITCSASLHIFLYLAVPGSPLSFLHGYPRPICIHTKSGGEPVGKSCFKRMERTFPSSGTNPSLADGCFDT